MDEMGPTLKQTKPTGIYSNDYTSTLHWVSSSPSMSSKQHDTHTNILEILLNFSVGVVHGYKVQGLTIHCEICNSSNFYNLATSMWRCVHIHNMLLQ